MNKITNADIDLFFGQEEYKRTSDYIDSGSSIKFICPNGHHHQISWDKWKMGRRCGHCAGRYSINNSVVDSCFSEEGYQRLSDYINNSTPIKFVCKNGHHHQIRWDKWRSGQRCRYCVDSGAKLRTSIDLICENLKSEGYTLISENYKNSQQKLECFCPENHHWVFSWSNWRNGKRCALCARNSYSIDDVRKKFASEGYTLISNEYANSKAPLNFLCPKGHTHFITLTNWLSGTRCAYCSSRPPVTNEDVDRLFSAEGYVRLSDYINAKKPVSFLCPKGHEHEISISSWKSGSRCGMCNGTPKLSLEKIRDDFAKEGYTLLSTSYKDNSTKLKCLCPENHLHQISWGHWKTGKRCAVCFQGHTKGLDYKLWQMTGKIKARLKRQIAIADKAKTWKDYFSDSEIIEISSKILSFYGKRSAGESLDHIIPCSWFDLTRKNELLACWEVKNLRFLPLMENISRGNKIKKAEFLRLLETHADILSIASRIPKTYQEIISSLDPAE